MSRFELSNEFNFRKFIELSMEEDNFYRSWLEATRLALALSAVLSSSW